MVISVEFIHCCRVISIVVAALDLPIHCDFSTPEYEGLVLFRMLFFRLRIFTISIFMCCVYGWWLHTTHISIGIANRVYEVYGI